MFKRKTYTIATLAVIELLFTATNANATTQTSKASSVATSSGCEVTGEMPEYAIQPGTKTYDGKGGPVKLVNKTLRTVSLTSAWMRPKTMPPQKWGEYCIYKNEFKMYPDSSDGGKLHPGQNIPGIGEVGCIHKQSAEAEYPRQIFPHVGDSPGLPLAPGECVVINGYTQTDDGTSYTDNSYQVSTVVGGGSLRNVRQPALDQIFTGDATRQTTNFIPIVNKSGKPQYFHGASIYVATSASTTSTIQDEIIDDGCIYILKSSGEVRRSYCRTEYPTQRNGLLLVSPEKIAPGESVVAQMAHSAPANTAWGAAYFLYLSDSPVK